MADYIIEPLDTDIDTIFKNFVEFIQSYFPDWNPSEGQLDVIIGRYFAMQTAFTADMASRVQRAIYRYFGATMAGIPPLPGSSASASIVFTISDPNDPPVEHTLDFGTLVGLTDRDGDLQMFSTIDDMVVPAGSGSASVDARAIELGSISNGLTGTVQMIEQVDWVGGATVAGVSSGGSDPEDDDVYIQRMTENLALMAPRPLLAEDFATYAKNIPGVWRAAAIDNFRPGVNELKQIISDYTGGSWRLTFMGKQTAPISATCTAQQLSSAMAAMANFEATDGNFSGGPLPTNPIVIEFKGKYAYTDVPAITIDTSSLTGGTSMAASTTLPGEPYGTDEKDSIAISAVDEDGNPLADSIKQQVIDYLQATRAQNFVVTFVDPAYHSVDVDYTATALARQDPNSVRTDADNNLMTFLLPSKWGVYPYQSQSRIWILQSKVRYLELTTILETTPGVDYTEHLAFSLDGSTINSSDKSFTGSPFALTTPGSINGQINLPV